MNSAIVLIVSLSLFYCGYRFYSKYISKKIYDLDDTQKTPSHIYKDNIDYIPTNKHILFGHHFTSIAGAAPIIGPCIAVFWGWAPALLWVVLGTIFMGAVQDFGALAMSLKEKGRSIADITSNVINKIHDTSNSYRIDVNGDCTGDYELDVKMENIRLLTGDYKYHFHILKQKE